MRFIKPTAVILSGIMLCGALTACSGNEQNAADTKTATQQVSQGDLILGLGADGRVALPVTNVNFGVSGVISKIYVSVGDTVKAGDLLAELDDTDYQYAIAGAQNNLNKAQTAYDSAKGQYEHSLLSDEKELNKLRDTITAGFDDYQYRSAITDAELNLERRRKDLDKAREKAKDPFDSYTYDNQIADAERTLTARQREFDAAAAALSEAFDDYTYRNAISEAAINLERKKAAYDEAAEDAGFFDSYSYDNAVANAEINAKRKEEDYYNAMYEYYLVLTTPAAASVSADDDDTDNPQIGGGQQTQDSASALSKMNAALLSWEDAERALVNAKNDRERARLSYDETAADKVKSAEQARDDAERQYKKAITDMERAVAANGEALNKTYETARDSLEAAEINLSKLTADRERARQQAVSDADAQIINARAAVTDAQTALDKAVTNMERARADYNKQISDTKVDLQLKQMNADLSKNANSTVSNALFALQEAELLLAEAENNLEKVKVYAPIDGQILSISKGADETVTEQSSGAPGAMMFGTSGSASNFMTISDVTRIYLRASITEGDIVGITDGQEIRVSIDAIGDDTFGGTVSNIDSIPSTDANGITTYTVTCVLDETSGVIKDGMNAYITFVRHETKNVLLVSNRAVFMEDELQYVNVVKEDGSYEKRKVVCGLSNGVQTEVISGLSAGETVVAGRLT